VIAVFAVPGLIWISPERQRTLGPFWWFVLSDTYVLTALAIALVLAAGCRRRVSTPPYSLFAATDADHRAVQAG
jgi:hypothetical protein